MIEAGDKDVRSTPAGEDCGEMLSAIQTFLATCRNPALLEHGEEMVVLRPGEYGLEIRSERLWVEAWSETRTISRRIVGIERRTTGALECSVHRFGGNPGRVSFLDLDRPQTAHKTMAGMRQNFAEQFRRMLHRQFPGWEIRTLSSGLDLQRSFSSIFPRAWLARGNEQIAALACATREDEDEMLTFGLIWHHYLRTRSRGEKLTTLALFVPDTAGVLTAQRLRWLDPGRIETRIFRFNRHGSAGEVDVADLGNLAARVGARADDGAGANGLARKTDNGSERQLEFAVRSNMTAIDARLLPAPVHSQVFALAGRDRDLIDLLAVTSCGRVAVLELKICENVQLPIQALDYWMRVNRHVEAGELGHLFPGVAITRERPRLLLVSPATSFHSSNAVVLSYFSQEIDVERVGIRSDWQQRFRVVLRLSGADLPISHRRSGEMTGV